MTHPRRPGDGTITGSPNGVSGHSETGATPALAHLEQDGAYHQKAKPGIHLELEVNRSPAAPRFRRTGQRGGWPLRMPESELENEIDGRASSGINRIWVMKRKRSGKDQDADSGERCGGGPSPKRSRKGGRIRQESAPGLRKPTNRPAKIH